MLGVACVQHIGVWLIVAVSACYASFTSDCPLQMPRLVYIHYCHTSPPYPTAPFLPSFPQIIILRLITPASYIYLVAVASWVCMYPTEDFNYGLFGNELLFALLSLFCVSEALFFPYYYFLFTRINSSRHALEHSASDPDSRRRLVRNCIDAMKVGREDAAVGVIVTCGVCW